MIIEARIHLPARWGIAVTATGVELDPGGEVMFPPSGVVGRILRGRVDRVPGSEDVEMILTLELDDQVAAPAFRQGTIRDVSIDDLQP